MTRLLVAALAAAVAPAHAEPPAAPPCADASTHLFVCTTAAKKQIVVCGQSLPSPWIQYQFGPASAPELVFPASRAGSPAAFTVAETTTAMASGYAVSFTNDGVTYTVSELAGAGGPNGAANNVAGVTVEKDGKTLATVACAGSATARWTDLDAIVNPPSP